MARMQLRGPRQTSCAFPTWESRCIPSFVQQTMCKSTGRRLRFRLPRRRLVVSRSWPMPGRVGKTRAWRQERAEGHGSLGCFFRAFSCPSGERRARGRKGWKLARPPWVGVRGGGIGRYGDLSGLTSNPWPRATGRRSAAWCRRAGRSRGAPTCGERRRGRPRS